jgi:hypothetical protein
MYLHHLKKYELVKNLNIETIITIASSHLYYYKNVIVRLF